MVGQIIGVFGLIHMAEMPFDPTAAGLSWKRDDGLTSGPCTSSLVVHYPKVYRNYKVFYYLQEP